jgi:hypothetical protein
MTDEQPTGLTFTVRDGGAKPSEAPVSEEKEVNKEEPDHAVANTKSGPRRKG